MHLRPYFARAQRTLNAIWNRPGVGLLLVLIVVGGVAFWLTGCGSTGGWTMPWDRPSNPDGSTPPLDPFSSLWWIAPAGVLLGLAMVALLGMRREGVVTIAASIALAVLLNWLRENMTLILLISGAGAVAYFLGNGQERLSALRGAWKLRAEGKDEEATALMRQALPWVDKRFRSQSKKRAKSGTIKPGAGL